jgi:hypothetical protein
MDMSAFAFTSFIGRAHDGPAWAGIAEIVRPFLTCKTLSGDADLVFCMWARQLLDYSSSNKHHDMTASSIPLTLTYRARKQERS